ncbi:tRNA (adenosine(37)-N6)-threonylcarbamoyltransferase complex ATPase subunit type 1 TsaE [Candidatus Uhrbacteria bacterium]|nr:tRNA (adenosine(37)-N6)-threonylcarbamoyltransferase complex ATPase subunit type 1 TsaE [Candidatus Uhrbacteria bacterium]
MRKAILTKQKDCQRFTIPTENDWEPLAEYLASRLKPGDAVALSGPLGAGKTTFVQHLARALGVKKIPSSPTFALMRSYSIPGRRQLKRLLHVDAYRIDDERDILALDLDDELSDGRAALVLEWPEHVPRWIKKRASVWSLEIRGEPISRLRRPAAPGVEGRKGGP